MSIGAIIGAGITVAFWGGGFCLAAYGVVYDTLHRLRGRNTPDPLDRGWIAAEVDAFDSTLGVLFDELDEIEELEQWWVLPARSHE